MGVEKWSYFEVECGARQKHVEVERLGFVLAPGHPRALAMTLGRADHLHG